MRVTTEEAPGYADEGATSAWSAGAAGLRAHTPGAAAVGVHTPKGNG